MDKTPLMTPDDLAQLLGVPLQQVYRLSHEARIPKIKLSRRCLRFSRSEIDKWLRRKVVKPTKGVDE
jgi:excisionase family DNA binding protein